MKLDSNGVKNMKRWHVPCSIATLAMGIYLLLVYMVPTFAQEYHDAMFRSSLYKVVPIAIFMLIGSPVFSLWFYSKVENDNEFRDWYFEE